MTAAMFKLESFSSAMAGHGAPVTFTREAVDRAFADGLAEGLARKESDDLRNLGAGLERLQRGLSDDHGRRSQLRQEAVEALAPILTQMLDCLVPSAESQRLEKALNDELVRLARAHDPLRAIISCNAALRPMVDRCLTETGITDIDVIEAETDRISLSLRGGRIELSPDTIARDIRQLIAELQGENATWTP